MNSTVRNFEKEYSVKVAIMLKILALTNRMDKRGSLPTSRFKLLILGKSGLPDVAEKLFERSEFHGFSVERTYSTTISNHNYDMVFIADSVSVNIDEAIAFYSKKNAIVISDIKDFVKNGGDIELMLTDTGKIKLIINQRSSIEKNFIYDKQLLSPNVSIIVNKSN